SNETSSEQAVVPSINYINKTNISNDLNLGEQTQKIIVKNEAHKENEGLKGSPLLARGVGGEEERKSSAKKKEKNEVPKIQEIEKINKIRTRKKKKKQKKKSKKKYFAHRK